jgi:hypothetical protein
MKKLLASRKFLVPVGTLISGLIIFTLVSILIIRPAPPRSGQVVKDPLYQSSYNTVMYPNVPSASSAKKSTPLVAPLNGPHSASDSYKSSTSPCATPTYDLKVLVLSADGSEVDLPAIEQELNFLGTPYTVYMSTKTPNGLTEALLDDGACHAFYNGVILTNGDLAYTNGSQWMSGLSQTEWTTLWSFEAKFGIRAVSWYTFPNADFGFQNNATAISTDTTPYTGTFTAAGKAIFPYLNTNQAFSIQHAYTYLDAPATDGSTSPLISDAQGNALAAIHTYTDGRQILAMTFDSNQFLTHSIILSYGLVNWVTKGLFIGQEGVYLESQFDDTFIDDNIWSPTTACGTPVDTTPTTYRITGDDLRAVIKWQHDTRSDPLYRKTKLDLVFNGYGAQPDSYPDDTLTRVATNNQADFIWTNHTFDHANMDNDNASFVTSEIEQNVATAQTLGLTDFTTTAMVTPDISGLRDATFLNAAYATGIRYLVSDSSQPGENNPAPNEGIADWVNPQILLVPRHPTNLFFNVSTPAEWVAEYNCLYQSFWGQNLTYQQILDVESQTLLLDMITGNVDPEMYHQPNLRAYDGVHTLYGDLIDETFAKYSAIFNVPVQSLRLDQMGIYMANKTLLRQSGVTASVTGHTLTMTVSSGATIPVTGKIRSGAGYTMQRSQWIDGEKVAFVPLVAGQSITIQLS